MKKWKLSVLLIALSVAVSSFVRAEVDWKPFSVGNISCAIWNTGVVGYPQDPTANPSGWWPADTNDSYIYEGDLWIGARVNGEVAVSRTDGRQSEFWPTDDVPQIVSEVPGGTSEATPTNQRIYFKCTDMNQDVNSGTPLGIEVEFEGYQWSFLPLSDFFVIEYRIRNVGSNILEDLFVAFRYDIDISSGEVTNPNYAGDDFVALDQTPDGLNPTDHPVRNISYGYSNGTAPGYVGLRVLDAYLGNERNASGARIPFRGHKRITINTGPTTDEEIYMLISTAGIDPLPAEPDDQRFIQSHGPIPFLEPGQQLHIVVAVGIGEGLRGLRSSMDWAQRLYDTGYAASLPDPNLETAIRKAVGKPTDPLVVADLSALTALDAGSLGIVDLSGLEYCVNLTKLDLNTNQVVSVAQVENLVYLTSLDLGNNEIRRIDTLQNLNRLSKLNLSNNRISNLNALVLNTGLGAGDLVDVRTNPLNGATINRHILALRSRGVDITFEPTSAVSFADIAVAPDPIEFDATVGSATQLVLSIGNEGNADLNISNITSDLGDWLLISEMAFTVFQGAAPHQVMLTLIPTASATLTGILTILSNDPDAPTEVRLVGHIREPNRPLMQGRQIGGSGTGELSFVEGYMNARQINNHDYELRFVNTMQPAIIREERRAADSVPFELWDLGFQTLEDPSDDIRIWSLFYDYSQGDGVWTAGESVNDMIVFTDVPIVDDFFSNPDHSPDHDAYWGYDPSNPVSRYDWIYRVLFSESPKLGDVWRFTSTRPNELLISVVPSTIDFGQAVLNVPKQFALWVGNIGTTDLNVISITSDLGKSLVVSETSFTVTEGIPSYPVTLTLIPNTTGETNGRLIIVSNDSASPTTVAITASVSSQVGISDPNMEMAIRNALCKPAGILTDADLLNLVRLDASNRDISDLTGLEYATNLTWLQLEHNNISVLFPLAHLAHLQVLYLDDNAVQNIDPLLSIPQLGESDWAFSRDGVRIHLGLSNNPITDISPLAGNPGLNAGDGIDLGNTSLNQESVSVYVPQLRERGVHVIGVSSFWGDVSGNGELDAQDASLVLQHVVQRITLSESQRALGDVSGKENLTTFDAALILMKLAGIIQQFPVEQDTAGPAVAVRLNPQLLTLGSVQASPGEVICLPLSLDDAEGVVSGELQLTYDQESLTFEAVEPSELLSHSEIQVHPDEGQVSVVFAQSAFLKAMGELLQLRFRVSASDWIEESHVHLSSVRLNEGPRLAVSGGKIRIVPKQTVLLPNYPNPFNPETWIPYQLAEDGDVTLRIFDVTGRLVRELALGERSAGVYVSRSHAAYWDGRNTAGESVASGVYLIRLQAGEFSQLRRVLLRK